MTIPFKLQDIGSASGHEQPEEEEVDENEEVGTEAEVVSVPWGPKLRLRYRDRILVGFVLAIADVLTDALSAFENISYLTLDRIWHGILILMPLVLTMFINQTSENDRKQNNLLDLPDKYKESLELPEKESLVSPVVKSWWLKAGITAPCYWSYQHFRIAGKVVRNKNPSELLVREFYSTKQMLQLSVKVEAQMEASFQAWLTLFRILDFYEETSMVSFGYWLAIVSLICSCLSMGWAASSDLVKTNIKGRNVHVWQNSDGLPNSVATGDEAAAIEKFCQPQSLRYNISRIAALFFQTGATLIANLLFVYALYQGYFESSQNPSNDGMTSTTTTTTTVLPTDSNTSEIDVSVKPPNQSILTLAATTARECQSGVSVVLGLFALFFINTLFGQLVWGVIAAKEYLLQELFCNKRSIKESWRKWTYFVTRSPFICIFRSASLYYYSLEGPLIAILTLHNGVLLVFLMIPAIIYAKLIGYITIWLFFISLAGYFFFTAVAHHYVQPADRNTIPLAKYLIIQRIAQLP